MAICLLKLVSVAPRSVFLKRCLYGTTDRPGPLGEASEEEEEARWEEGFPDDLAASFYYYSYQVVKEFDK